MSSASHVPPNWAFNRSANGWPPSPRGAPVASGLSCASSDSARQEASDWRFTASGAVAVADHRPAPTPRAGRSAAGPQPLRAEGRHSPRPRCRCRCGATTSRSRQRRGGDTRPAARSRPPASPACHRTGIDGRVGRPSADGGCPRRRCWPVGVPVDPCGARAAAAWRGARGGGPDRPGLLPADGGADRSEGHRCGKEATGR